MPIHNNDIAGMFEETADLLEIRGENPFRIRAYRNAARTVQGLGQSAADLVAEGKDLSEYSGIGKDLAGKIGQIVETGKFEVLEDLKKKMPGELSRLMKISGLGARRVATIYKELNISTLEELKQAIEQGRLRDLRGFGKKTEENILGEIKRLGGEEAERTKLVTAEQYAEPLLEYLRKAKGVKDICAAGSFRRRRETVGDLDILVTCKRGSNVMDHLVKYEEVQKVVSKGETKSTVVLRSNLQVDVRVVEQVSFGAALAYFTGSKEHNIALRKIGVSKKLKLNEYGVFKGDERVAGQTEESVYRKLGLKYVEPELREDRGEVEAAKEDKLPKLIKAEDIKGDLHVHTNYTDGNNTVEEMAQAAREMGYSYVAITDHSQHVSVANGLKPEEVRKQIKEIDKVNEKLKGIAILKGTEVDILDDGSLDLPDDVLKELDVRVCAIHYKFNLSKDKQTERVIRAMDNPYFNILAHPTGRLIGERSGYEIDVERLLEAAKERGCFLELNSHPDRLDLNDIDCKMAREMGVKVVISTDSHRPGHLHLIRFGIGQARRGWLEAADVVNTRPLNEVKKLLTRK